MLRNRNIIFFGDDWGRHPSTVQHIGRVLARSNRVLWVNTLGSRSPRLQLYDIRRVVRKLGALVYSPRPRLSDTTVEIVQPFVIPFYDVATIRRLNARLLTSLLQTKIRAMSFERPILMSGTPLMADIVGTLKETSSHYFCTDDYSKFENVFDAFDGMEQLMIQKVDCMFATSEVLLRTRRPKQREGVFLPQGVDTLHFSRRPGEIPESMQMLPKPIVGFFGMIASWVDMDLVVKCARKYPNASFVLIGRLGIDPKVFDGMSNIRYLGEISYEQLPRYAQAFDVGLIPFVKNELTTAANPLKMLEYLSLGIPVVSTALPETEKFEDIIHVAQSGNDFVEYVGLALGENSIEEQMRRRHRAEGYSWNRIVDLVSDSIEHIERQQA